MPPKLDTARVFEAVFEVYRAQAGLFLPVALAVFIPVAIVQALLRAGSASIGLVLVAALLGIVATFAYEGMIVEAVRDIQDGVRDFTAGGLVRSVMPVLGAIIGASLLAGLGITVGLVLIIVPGLVLLTWWALIVPAIVIERAPAMDAFGRSRALVRGNGWRVFGVIVVFWFMQFVLSAVLSAIFVAIAGRAAGTGIANLAVNTLVAPLSAIASTIMYLHLRRLHGEAPPPAGPSEAVL